MARPSNAEIKRRLSARFPATTFRVFSGRGTSSSWTHIAWSDGPSDGLVRTFLASIGSKPGYMDNTDYFNGERVSCERHVSDGFRQRVATALVAPYPVPPADTWHHGVRRSNGGGWYDFRDCVWQALQRRDEPFWGQARFDALAWLAARESGSQNAPTGFVETPTGPRGFWKAEVVA